MFSDLTWKIRFAPGIDGGWRPPPFSTALNIISDGYQLRIFKYIRVESFTITFGLARFFFSNTSETTFFGSKN